MSLFLAITDNENFISELTGALSKTPHEIVAVKSGFTALEAIKLRKFDFLISSQKLPYMSGMKTITSVRRICEYEKIPVIFVISGNDPKIISQCIPCGAVDFFYPPFSDKMIKKKIDYLLELQKNKKLTFLKNYTAFTEQESKQLAVSKDLDFNEFVSEALGMDLIKEIHKLK